MIVRLLRSLSLSPRLPRALADATRSLADLLAPAECRLCSRTLTVVDGLAPEGANAFCPDCFRDVLSDYHHCLRCAAPVARVLDNETCIQCRKRKFRFDRVVVLGPYDAALRDIVVRMKRPPEALLRRSMGELMGQAWE